MSEQQRGLLLTPKELEKLPSVTGYPPSFESLASFFRESKKQIAQLQLDKVINELFGPGKAIVPTNIPNSTKKTFIIDKEKLERFWEKLQGE